jgi:CRISPR-associated endonuclease Cas1
MAASSTLPHESPSSKSAINRSGVLTLFGYGIKVRMQAGHLEIEDGIGPERRRIRLARVGHRLKRLVVVGAEGYLSLAALRWLADQGVSFSMLCTDGTALLTTGPVRPSEAKLRRAQALAHSSGVALRISCELINRKLVAQEDIARHKLLDTSIADIIARFRAELQGAQSIGSVRLIEAQAARAYWSAWSALPINFPKNQLARVPAHWLSFGTRVSPLTGSPRLACNPPNAMLNYLYSLLEAEARLAAATLGLDPGLGVLHTDTSARDSLACDLMEPVRPRIDAYVLDWITKEMLNRKWFSEQSDGNCRLVATLATRLSDTTPMWYRHVAPVAEWVTRAFWLTIRKPDTPFVTRLTQNNKRQAKGALPVAPVTTPPRRDNLCGGCGKTIRHGRSNCALCAVDHATKNMIQAARLGRQKANSPKAQLKRTQTQRQNALAQHAWKSSDQPEWLTEQFYAEKIQPALAQASASVIARQISVSRWYAGRIREGYRPHPRHWLVLSEMVGISQGT